MASFSFAAHGEALAGSASSEVPGNESSKARQVAAVVIFAFVNLAVSIGVCTIVFSALAN